jgi:hypothetical protein
MGVVCLVAWCPLGSVTYEITTKLNKIVKVGYLSAQFIPKTTTALIVPVTGRYLDENGYGENFEHY